MACTRGGDSQRCQAGRNKQHIPHEFIWDDNAQPFRVFDLSGSPGVKVFSIDNSCPLEIFETFLMDDMVVTLLVMCC